MLHIRDEWSQSILLQVTEGTAKEGIVRYGQLGFICSLWIDNSNICFLAKIPRVKVFCSEIPDPHIVKWYQDCSPCARIDLDRQREIHTQGHDYRKRILVSISSFSTTIEVLINVVRNSLLRFDIYSTNITWHHSWNFHNWSTCLFVKFPG